MESWFENQVRDRVRKDNEETSAAFDGLSAIISGKKSVARHSSRPTQSAVEEICRFYKIPFPVDEKAPDDEEREQTLERLLRPSGVMRRRVYLDGEWWKNATGAFLAETTDGAHTALIPGLDGYKFHDYKTGRIVKIGKDTSAQLKRDATCFYRSLPGGKLAFADLWKFMLASIQPGDAVWVAASILAVTLLGMFTPYITQMLFAHIIPTGQTMLGVSVGVLLFGVAISSTMIAIFRTLMTARISAKLDVSVQSAIIGRIVNLPVEFFKEYSAGDLANRAMLLNAISKALCEIVFGSVFAALFSFVYLFQISALAPGMALPALLAVLVQTAAASLNVYATFRVNRKSMTASTKVSGIVYALFSGVQKIKLAACEKRAFTKWARAYGKQAEANYHYPLLPIAQALQAMSGLVGSLILFASEAVTGTGYTGFISLLAAYGLINGALLSLFALAPVLGQIKPMLEMGKPIIEAPPEVSESKRVIRRLSGNIEVNNLSFRYTERSPMIIDDLSLKIRRGQYVAIVGKTGCGKSTLLRLLLGFETPLSGAIYYDNEDITKIDLRSLRQKIGCVLQNGKLFQGDIYSNIIISKPTLTMDEAWEAAELAGVADAIRDMPMGMHTVVTEGSGGISGGQRQRLMIARAIAPKPKVLFFDEATSALDNLTQKQVSDSLAALKSTRVVIAHRLSTIKQCDRIIVLDKGRIVEDGTYGQLIALNGFFAELIKRQQLDEDVEQEEG
jgi:NHLM bacteriocin system ABC transporter ATP-binding protein